MHRGRVVEIGPTEAIYRDARHPYTAELLASTPSVSGAFLAMPARPDDALSSLPEAACRYASRCALRERLGRPDRCAEEDPELSMVAPGHLAACHFSAKVAMLTDEIGVEAHG
jgi:oligopeptide/dipeptide ABC transporter ATP-binding protein